MGSVPVRPIPVALRCCTAMLSRCIKKVFDRGSPAAVDMHCPTSAKNAAVSCPVGSSVSVNNRVLLCLRLFRVCLHLCLRYPIATTILSKSTFFGRNGVQTGRPLAHYLQQARGARPASAKFPPLDRWVSRQSQCHPIRVPTAEPLDSSVTQFEM